ncbi:anthocyanidin 3-O-glucosyltransferase 5-like [Jatropha curcas]|uniref:anthocyanidin 3-O-glucosyltransferase 5-like n=1 Tax=Jatropha curcas TaxID=180498 RepID=UPI0018942D74|nr:anthocyanidin 3-O-glucosyltransferase 5-like [Jatropha curcas]
MNFALWQVQSQRRVDSVWDCIGFEKGKPVSRRIQEKTVAGRLIRKIQDLAMKNGRSWISKAAKFQIRMVSSKKCSAKCAWIVAHKGVCGRTGRIVKGKIYPTENHISHGLAPIIKARVAVLPSPGIGHITPLLDLSKRLVLHHELQVGFLVITTNESSTALQKLLHSPTIPPGLDIVQLPPVNVFAVATDTMPVLTRLCVVVEESLRSLKSVLIELGKPKALVIDLFCTQDFQVCNELSIPVYSFFTASNALLTLSLCLPTLDREVDGEFIDLQEPAKVPGCTPIQTQDLLDQIKNRKIDEYKWYLINVSRLPLAAGIFINSWENLVLAAVVENKRKKKYIKKLVFA